MNKSYIFTEYEDDSINEKVTEIMALANMMPLGSKEDRMKFAKKCMEVQFTSKKEEEWVDDEKKDDEIVLPREDNVEAKD